MKKNTKFIISAIFLAISIIVYGINSTRNGFQLLPSSSMYINIPESAGQCVQVTNSSTKEIFIPTKSLSEWNDFKTNKPSGVNIIESCPTCSGGGFFYQNYCYYVGGLNQSCDDVCSSKGGVDNLGTDFIGNDATDPTRCGDVVRAIHNNAALFAVDGAAGTADINGLSCVYTIQGGYASQYLRAFGRAQDSSFKDPDVSRYCACVN